MRSFCISMVLLLGVGVVSSFATIFGTVRGVVHDLQHRPVPGAEIMLRSRTSDWSRTCRTNNNGEFEVMAVPVGQYIVSVTHQGFRNAEQQVSVYSGSGPVLHLQLALAGITLSVEVISNAEFVIPESSTSESIVDRKQIERLPGAQQTNSLAMITNMVPGASMAHDQLHIRGGHQATWLIDGIPLPNTNIASNVGPQIDPKDIDYLEIKRGGLSAEYGDRTYGIFNVQPRSGFERNNSADIVLNYGDNNTSNDQVSFGGHSARFAYYGSLTAYRTDLGLQPTDIEALHDSAAGVGGFTSLIYNPTPSDQLRLSASLRGDHYQVPNNPDDQALGVRDIQEERDAFAVFSWAHTMRPGLTLTVSPLLHRNSALYDGRGGDFPIIPRDDRTSTYGGYQAAVSLVTKKHNLRAGLYGIAQHDNQLFGLRSTDGSGLSLAQSQTTTGNLDAAIVEDQYKLTPWLTLNGGVRLTYFSGLLTEKVASPRGGAAVKLPGLHWVVRGFYGRYYQPPPLSTVSGPLLDLALNQGFGFLPLRGERDEQKEVGLTIPIKGWAFDFTYYHTNAANFFDHDVLGNSNIFLPLTIAAARLRGWEATVQSPMIFNRAHVHLAYSHQWAQGQGAVTGGLTDFSPVPDGLFYLDHDQRDTLSAGFETQLPWHAWASADVAYGSGFLNGDGPAHMSGHTTVDMSLGRSFGDRLALRIDALNVADSRYLSDNSNTLGGTHYNYPRQISLTLCYRIHY